LVLLSQSIEALAKVIVMVTDEKDRFIENIMVEISFEGYP